MAWYWPQLKKKDIVSWKNYSFSQRRLQFWTLTNLGLHSMFYEYICICMYLLSPVEILKLRNCFIRIIHKTHYHKPMFCVVFLKKFVGVDLQCCVSFRCTAKWISYTCIYIPLFFRFFSHIGHYRVLSRVPCAIRQVVISYTLHI